MDIFEMTEYREVIKAKIESNRSTRGYKQNLVKAGGFHHTFLSQVLNGSANLTADHALGLAVFWDFSELETDYFIEMVSLSRAARLPLKERIRRRLSKLKDTKNDLKERLHANYDLTEDFSEMYYSSWIWSAIHIALSVPGLNTPNRLAMRLKIPIGLVESCLATMSKAGIVSKKGANWQIENRDLHLPNSSRFTQLNHCNWRSKQVMNLMNEPQPTGVHYTGIHALSKKDAAKIDEMLRDMIENTRLVIRPSPEEEVYSLLCDFSAL